MEVCIELGVGSIVQLRCSNRVGLVAVCAKLVYEVEDYIQSALSARVTKNMGKRKAIKEVQKLDEVRVMSWGQKADEMGAMPSCQTRSRLEPLHHTQIFFMSCDK
jgi:hypothetical protein